MFKSKATPSLSPSIDFTNSLRERSFYKFGQLRAFGLGGEVKATAFDPVVGLLAVGTSTGQIHISGQPAFQCTLSLSSPGAPAGLGVKFLTFWVGMGKIICIDSKDQLHMWDLNFIEDRTNLPHKDVTYSLYGNVTYIETPTATHSHLFFTLKDGITLAYDLLRYNLSPYKIPNVWHAHEERMRRSGIPGHRKTFGPPMATCLAVNPRDINVMLIGYEGGVIAWDVQKETSVKTFEMVLPPGSPGGGSYLDPDGLLFTERAPGVTCICWRPDGLVFAVGHEDGCITFWAYDEPDKPLLVRTLETEDVNVTDAESLFDAGALDTQLRKKDADGNLIHQSREPIFKLAWASFPDGPSLKALVAAQGSEAAGDPLSNATVEYSERGETLLLVLGGQFPRDQTAINVLQLPAYTPPPPRKISLPTSPSESMSVQDRYAFRDSLAPTGSSSYPTKTPAEDFILLPRSSPYFSLCHDPVAIVVTLGADHSQPQPAHAAARGIEAWSFPPPRSTVVPPSPGRKSFLRPGEDVIVAMTPAPQLSGAGQLTPRSASQSSWRMPWSAGADTSQLSVPTTPQMPKRPKRRLRVPSAYWTGGLTVIGCELMSLSTPAFKQLISWSIEKADDEDEPRIPLHGGLAVPDLHSHGAPDLKVAKMEAYRVLITYHTDATVRFWDISPQLLLLPSPLRFEYPSPLPHLTISIGDYISHPSMAHLPLAKLWHEDRPKVKISSVHLAVEALECIVTMVTGETIITKFGEARRETADLETLRLENDEGISYFPNGPSEAAVEEVTDLGDLAKYREDGFKPVALVTTRRGDAVACAVSDIGFLAVAYANNSMAIVDLRGPEVLLREGFDEDGEKVKKKRKKATQNVVGEQSAIATLKWVISGLGPDPTPLPRLIVSYARGLTKIYTLTQVLGEWIVDPKALTFTHESLASPLASFVLDPSTGQERLPSRDALQTVMRGGSYEKDSKPHSLWIACAKKTIRCQVNFSGERVAKVEMEGEEFASVHLVTRHGNKVLAGITSSGSVLFYTLPTLEFITRFDLFLNTGVSRPIGRISLDDRSGDFMEVLNPQDITLRTLFHFRKPLAPRIEPCPPLLKRAIPPQPVPITSTAGYGAWIWGGAPLTGAQLDALVAGPNRPGPPKAPAKPSKPLITWGNPPEEVEKPAAGPSTTKAKTPAKKPAAAAAVDRRERQDVYTEMRNAAAQRGDYLDDLSAKMKGVEESAGSMVSAAKNLYMKEAAKGAAKGFFGKLM